MEAEGGAKDIGEDRGGAGHTSRRTRAGFREIVQVPVLQETRREPPEIIERLVAVFE